MAEAEIAGLFTKVGASASRLAGKDTTERYRAVGTFGIGVVSYFLVCDEYEVQTKRGDSKAIGLLFGRQMLDGLTPAREVAAERSDTGTTLRLHVRDERLFQLLLERFPHWMRDVAGLTAWLVPDGVKVAQGGISRAVRPVTIDLPEWVEAAHIGPPTELSQWDAFDGRARVDISYRGVHVDRLEVPGLWGIEGAMHVDPRHFRPKLNREGFVGDQLRAEVETFLRRVHPLALVAALDTLREDLASDSSRSTSWPIDRWAAMWLAVPRGGGYEAANKAWDQEFASRPTFRLLGPDNERDVSIDDLRALPSADIFVAPVNLSGTTAVVRQAVRALRARSTTVIQGIARAPGFLEQASWAAQTTSDLLLSYFRDRLPPLKAVEPFAEELVRQESIADVFAVSPRVRLVRLASEATPLVAIGGEVWINIDAEAGKKVVREMCDRNDGTLGLWVACLIHCPGQTGEVAQVVRAPTSEPRLGPVMRQYLRGLIS
jgi:hypothetical protein